LFFSEAVKPLFLTCSFLRLSKPLFLFYV
jgi:hypothetical protein